LTGVIGTEKGAVSADVATVRVTAKQLVAEEVLTVELASPQGYRLRDWAPGAHIDLVLPNGMTRQYSLCGDRWDPFTYRVGVLREQAGRGGSAYVHDQLEVGDLVGVGGPRNNFALVPSEQYLFVAGGIGITPLLPMIEEAAHRGTDWRLLYLARSRERMAYVDDLLALHPDRVEVWPSRELGRFDLASVWARLPQQDAYVYACGPEELLSGLEESARAAGRESQVVVERFAARPAAFEPNRPFEVTLARSGTVVTVAEDDTVLDAVNRVGANVLSTCREGTCGTCEVRVLDGVPEHRDSVLGLEERLAGETMMACVSRCRGQRLVLDL
jgi:ferredoxin-NADP reductase